MLKVPFSINLSKLCVVALFMKNKDNVKAYCQTEVIPTSLLPKATYLFDGIWIIATYARLYFSIVCKNYTKVMLPKPPIPVLSLEMVKFFIKWLHDFNALLLTMKAPKLFQTYILN